MFAALLGWLHGSKQAWAEDRQATKGWFFDAELDTWRQKAGSWKVWEDGCQWVLEHPDHPTTMHPSEATAMHATIGFRCDSGVRPISIGAATL